MPRHAVQVPRPEDQTLGAVRASRGRVEPERDCRNLQCLSQPLCETGLLASPPTFQCPKEARWPSPILLQDSVLLSAAEGTDTEGRGCEFPELLVQLPKAPLVAVHMHVLSSPGRTSQQEGPLKAQCSKALVLYFSLYQVWE